MTRYVERPEPRGRLSLAVPLCECQWPLVKRANCARCGRAVLVEGERVVEPVRAAELLQQAKDAGW